MKRSFLLFPPIRTIEFDGLLICQEASRDFPQKEEKKESEGDKKVSVYNTACTLSSLSQVRAEEGNVLRAFSEGDRKKEKQ